MGSVGDDTDLYEVKKGVSFVLENLQLMTNCCLVHTTQGVSYTCGTIEVHSVTSLSFYSSSHVYSPVVLHLQ